MESAIIIVHILAAIGITGLVLIQHGKGADMGASFGSGASQTIFGSTGSGNALTQSTTWLATIFFVTSLALAFLAKQQAGQGIQNDSLLANPNQIETTLNTAPVSDIPQAAAARAETDLPQTPVQADAAAQDNISNPDAAPAEAENAAQDQ